MTDSGSVSRDEPVGLGGRPPTAAPSVPGPAGTATSGQDALLATKLHVPRPRPGFVPRQRLAEALGEGLARGRVLVCAPAGFGKTALLADWARGGGWPVAWLGLDGGDSDPARFWRYAVAALDRVRAALDPPGQQRRLAEPRRRADQHEAPPQPLAERLGQPRPRHITRRRAGQVQLGGQQHIRPGGGRPGPGRRGRVGHR